MNKTININLAGTFFHIDENAYGKLSRYLEAIKKSLSDPQGSTEIIRDIEARIAELFSEKIENETQVVTLKELDEVIAVMGQPEDYVVDEEIFDDTPYSAKRKTTSNNKQLFRDIDDKFIGGVSSGLGHYFGIDTIWIRLLWIVLVVAGFGSPVLVYILLWILVPAAESTSDKLKMTGEPINISNIEKKFKEGYENVADKVKNADYDKYGNKVKSGASGFFDTLGNIFLTLFKIFGKFIGVILILTALSTLVGLVVGLTTFGSMSLWGGEFIFIDNITAFSSTSSPYWLIATIALLAVGIPFFGLFILGLKLLVPNIKSVGNATKIILFVAWLASLIGLGILSIRQISETAYNGSAISEKTLQITPSDTLYLRMSDNNPYEYDATRSFGVEVVNTTDQEPILYSNAVRLIVRSTTDSIGKIVIDKSADGNSYINANTRAQNINFNYGFSNNTLVLDRYLTTDLENKFRDQEVQVIVYLPEGSVLNAHPNTYTFHRNNSYYDDILNNEDEGHYLKIMQRHTQCLDCPTREINEKTVENDWEIELNKKLNNDGDRDHITIDKNGVDINVTDDKDTLKIKIGNH